MMAPFEPFWRGVHADGHPMNIMEVVELLRLTEKAVYCMAQEAELPAFKIRRQRRIRCADLEDGITAQRRTPRRRR